MEIIKITFEDRYSFHQKTMLGGFAAISAIGFYNSISALYEVIGIITSIFFLMLTLFLLALIFSKKGLQKKGENLYKTISIKGITLLKSKIKLSDRPAVSILKIKKQQKFAFVSSANPDQSESFNSFEIFVLNQRHTKRDPVIYFKNEENATKAIKFLTTEFRLKHEIFSPDFS
ncbi:hypothetical protein [Altibacter lentus]|uniref:hypothetical protein n=1 Tax=Altibacter lentus TaxID=1223410 RepID=UPI0005571A98|nr:hypothetical protein [Altibacter lentus]